MLIPAGTAGDRASTAAGRHARHGWPCQPRVSSSALGSAHARRPRRRRPRDGGVRRPPSRRREYGCIGDGWLQATRVWVDGVDLTSRRRTVIDCLLTWPEQEGASLVDHVASSSAVRHRDPRTHGGLGQGPARRGSDDVHHRGRRRRCVVCGRAAPAPDPPRCCHRRLGGQPSGRPPTGARAVVDVWFPERATRGRGGRAGMARVIGRDSRTIAPRQNALVLAGCTVLRFTWRRRRTLRHTGSFARSGGPWQRRQLRSGRNLRADQADFRHYLPVGSRGAEGAVRAGSAAPACADPDPVRDGERREAPPDDGASGPPARADRRACPAGRRPAWSPG